MGRKHVGHFKFETYHFLMIYSYLLSPDYVIQVLAIYYEEDIPLLAAGGWNPFFLINV